MDLGDVSGLLCDGRTDGQGSRCCEGDSAGHD
jgi:hypothetical protein